MTVLQVIADHPSEWDELPSLCATEISCEGHSRAEFLESGALDVTSHEASSGSGAMRKSRHKISLHWMNYADRLTMKGRRKPLQCTACKESEMRKAGATLTWAGDASALGLTSQVPALLGSVFREKDLT